MLRDLVRGQRAHRRGSGGPRWRLYETPAGNVPKDLVVMFAGIVNAQIPGSLRPALTDREVGELDAVLRFIDRHGARDLLYVTRLQGDATPVTEKVKAAKGPLIELKIRSGQNNPRFLFVVCSDVAVFLAAFKKKTRKLSRQDIDRADSRFRTMKGGCA